MTDRQRSALSFLEKFLLGTTFNRQYRDWMLNVIKDNIDEIKIKNNRFVLKRIYYANLLRYIDNRHKQVFDRKKELKLDNFYYKFFNTLKRKGIIHKESSYFPKSLMLLSVNPNPFNLINTDFTQLDLFAKKIKEFKSEFDIEDDLTKIYIYLRIFHRYLFSKQMLENLTVNNIINISEDRCILVLYYKLYIKTKTNNRFYKIVVLDKTASSLFFKIKKTYGGSDSDKRVFDEIENFEKDFKGYKKEHLSQISMNLMKSVNKTYYTFQTSSIMATFTTMAIQTPPLSLAEINSIFPQKISFQEIEKEKEYIKSALTTFKNRTPTSDMDFRNRFDLYSLLYIENIMKNKVESVTDKIINKAIINIEKETEYAFIDSHKLIYLYIHHKLKKVLQKKIVLKTFRNYIYILNKHIFNMIEDLEHIQPEEIYAIMQRFENNNYTKHSIDSINRIIKNFFIFIHLKGFSIDIPSIIYPKSLVLKDELDDILKELEYEKLEYQRKTDKIKFILLQNKVIVLLAFYSGMRKNELRSRLLKDVYFGGDTLYIDVNQDGMKKLKLKLKTRSAKRRVEVNIESQDHLKLVREWLSLRERLKIKSKYLFLHIEGNKIFNKSIDEELFEDFNQVIQNVTKRYTSFHSLRHSFATYSFLKILQKKDNDKAYEFLELSIQMGHQTPQTTANKYIHYGFLQLYYQL